MITHGPLAWPVINVCDYAELGVSAQQAADCEQAAGEWLWQATAARFGLRAAVWRPVTTPLAPTGAPVVPLLAGTAAGYLPGALLCGPLRDPTVLLMPPPVAAVTAVTVDGTAVSPSGYRLEGDTLRRVDGGVWPTSQNPTAADGTAGTWSVTYTRGREVPIGGRRAAGLLACELAKRLTGAKDCKLPVNATTVSKNGTTITLDRNALQGLTNISEVDQWIRLVNPKGLQRRPAVFSPDTTAVPR